MLMTLGSLQFEVYPFNATEYDHSHQSDFVEKPILGIRPPLEWVGEGPETWNIRAILFPEKFGGLDDLSKLEQMRKSGRPQFLQRGDGTVLGWVAIEAVREAATYLDRGGVGKKIEVDIAVKASQGPAGGSYFSLMAGLFT